MALGGCAAWHAYTSCELSQAGTAGGAEVHAASNASWIDTGALLCLSLWDSESLYLV
jgi:hypothetical protein